MNYPVPSQPIVPVNLGVKYNPPKIGIQYHFEGTPDTAMFVHEIMMDKYFVSDQRLSAGKICDEIYQDHPHFLNSNVISKSQVGKIQIQ
jgi:hypothetical protein